MLHDVTRYIYIYIYIYIYKRSERPHSSTEGRHSELLGAKGCWGGVDPARVACPALGRGQTGGPGAGHGGCALSWPSASACPQRGCWAVLVWACRCCCPGRPFCLPLPRSPESRSVHGAGGSGFLGSSVNRKLHVTLGPAGSSRLYPAVDPQQGNPRVEAL